MEMERDESKNAGWVPHLTVAGASKAVEWYQEAFGAKINFVAKALDGVRLMHADLEIFGGAVMLNDEFPEFEAGHSVIRAPTSGGTTSVTMHVCGEDVDAVVEHARSAGADVIVEPHDAFWKARYALVKDPFGHCWSFSNRCKGEPAQPPAGMSNPSAAGEAEKEKEKE